MNEHTHNNRVSVGDRSATALPPQRRFESLSDIAARWGCHRTTARRILRTAGVRGYRLGEDRRGVLRYDAAEVGAYEARRCGG